MMTIVGDVQEWTALAATGTRKPVGRPLRAHVIVLWLLTSERTRNKIIRTTEPRSPPRTGRHPIARRRRVPNTAEQSPTKKKQNVRTSKRAEHQGPKIPRSRSALPSRFGIAFSTRLFHRRSREAKRQRRARSRKTDATTGGDTM